ncbi:acyl-CoA dehydrogenase [Verticiella sediminum]|uniref:Acyl-CoA dehydrogenase n=1 Tax=Verticiella sediminum TaxID=1247510 RepID=A0A556AIS8_9BURK|nr:acyl-CoA dehydrogenase [Verticiella sediminum]TSH92776.1 acyl-CoA dehydrogenase [Verticiella sediminum]
MTIQDDSLRPEEFAEAAAAAIADAQGREVREAAGVLAQAGLLGVCAAEDDGGLGLGIAFALPIVQTAGRLQLRFPLVEQVLLAKALAGTPEAAAIVAGEKLASIAWRGSLADGVATDAGYADQADWALVGDGEGAALIEMASVERQADTALDPEHPVYWLELDAARVLARLSAEAWAGLQEDARLLLAGSVHGAAEGALERTATYMATRVQFGRPLSAKQAVRHWLARMRLQQEASGAAIRRVLATDEFGQARAAATALASAIESAAFILEKAIHLHGGMGFTWEMPLHWSLRDIRKVDAAFGSGALAQDIGRAFIAAA